jgi:hypothetical protein
MSIAPGGTPLVSTGAPTCTWWYSVGECWCRSLGLVCLFYFSILSIFVYLVLFSIGLSIFAIFTIITFWNPGLGGRSLRGTLVAHAHWSASSVGHSSLASTQYISSVHTCSRSFSSIPFYILTSLILYSQWTNFHTKHSCYSLLYNPVIINTPTTPTTQLEPNCADFTTVRLRLKHHLQRLAVVVHKAIVL